MSMPLATISAYDVPGDVTLRRVASRHGPARWAVYHHGSCLSHAGEWEFEPQPSSRDDEFLDRCRFTTPEEAYAAWQRVREVIE